MNNNSFIVSQEDWSLHRKGYQDQMRHQHKVREAIKSNLPHLISEEQIIMSDGSKMIKFPIRSLQEYSFRYHFNKSKHVGQGDGHRRVGDILHSDPADGDFLGRSDGAGDQAGADIYEAEVSLEELESILFDELALPDLHDKDKQILHSTDIRFNDVRSRGLMANLDKKKTILESIRRSAIANDQENYRIIPDDLRFKTWEDIDAPHSNALIIAMMDTSGSMGAA